MGLINCFGSRGSEVQILSPRPIKSIGWKTLRVTSLACLRILMTIQPPSTVNSILKIIKNTCSGQASSTSRARSIRVRKGRMPWTCLKSPCSKAADSRESVWPSDGESTFPKQPRQTYLRKSASHCDRRDSTCSFLSGVNIGRFWFAAKSDRPGTTDPAVLVGEERCPTMTGLTGQPEVSPGRSSPAADDALGMR